MDGGFKGTDKYSKVVASDPQCVTHKDNEFKSQVSVVLEPTLFVRTVRALVVYDTVYPLHTYQAVEAQVPAENAPDDDPIVIVGGGPGGLGAARYLESLNKKYVLYERGEQMSEDFWTSSLLESMSDLPQYNPLGEGTYPTLYEGLGGNQNFNGAVFAPGTSADLANSLGVSEAQAKQAQDYVADWVVHDSDNVESPDFVDVGMMWAPTTEGGDTDFATLHSNNQKMARRSIAYDFTPRSGELRLKEMVTRVTDTEYTVDGTTYPHSGIILAAGALSSPQLLGRQQFEVTNHGYTVSFCTEEAPEKYTFEYPDADGSTDLGKTEIMKAAFPNCVENGNIQITMTMTEAFTHTARVTEDLPNTWGENEIDDPWHYMNTVDHTGMRVTGYNNVYIGDASALKVPFNCHTSMPAAAAGVLAAQALLGADLAPPESVDVSYETRARLFLAGLWVLGVGVTAHIVGSVYRKRTGQSPPPILGYIHYACQPTGTVLVTVSAAWAAALRDPSAATNAHRILGWTVIGLLWANVFGGAYFKYLSLTDKQNYTDETGKPHRITGYVITTLLMALAFTATVAGTGIDKTANAAAFAGILGFMLLLTFVPKSDYTPMTLM